jgi:signal transduction histidine kinase
VVSSSELRRVAAFSDLPEDQVEWFLSHTEEVSLRAGEVFVRQGDPPDWMFVFLEGLFQWRGEFGGDMVSLPAQAGEISGVLPFSRMKRFTVTGLALSPGRILKFPAELLPELVLRMPELTTRLIAMMSDRIREGTRIEQQRDRLISLGKLAAGLAHELNNPASAATRAADQMRDTLGKLRNANAELWRRPLSEAERARIEGVEDWLLQSGASLLDGLALIELEERLDAILKSRGCANSWELSAALARGGMPAHTLTSLLTELDAETARPALARIAAAAELSALLSAVENGAARISDLVQTIKEYTYMDQASEQNADIVQSLETTLDALAHLLRPGIKIQRNYYPNPLIVKTVGSELNQVWTNIIENAVEAMLGQGELRLRTFRDGRYVVVEIGDSGPGIPAEIAPHIFDPFFTTKGVGEGTGLGLNTVQTIVRKHGGSIQMSSKPGDTRFQVWLPGADPFDPDKSADP